MSLWLWIGGSSSSGWLTRSERCWLGSDGSPRPTLAEVTKRARKFAYVDSDDLAEHFGDHQGYIGE